MGNDLISREALKKAFANSEHIKETVCGLDVMEMLAIIEIIDNAPTVDIDLSGYSDKLWEKAYERGRTKDHTESG